MKEVLNIYKKRGETPLECIRRFIQKNPEYEYVPMTYAGRLDPLAEGVLIVLAGATVHRKNEFLSLPKTYEVEVLFGASTDTHDVLGLVEQISLVECDRKHAEEILGQFKGKQLVQYPAYSSKPVSGKPLFAWAREGKLNDILIPEREVEIYNISFEGWRELKVLELLEYIGEAVSLVVGDFRQEKILSLWNEKIGGQAAAFYIAKIRVESSSGAYMRSLAHEWGKKIGIPALALKIVRTKVGEYGIENSMRL